jgi:hypothetical protein
MKEEFMNEKKLPDRVFGYSAILGGIMTALFWFLHPSAADPNAAHDVNYWAAMASNQFAGANFMFVVILVLSLIAIIGIHEKFRSEAGHVTVFGFLLGFTGTALLIAGASFNAFIAPILASSEATRPLLETDGPVFGGPFAGMVALGGICFGLGYVVLGYKIFRGLSRLPKYSGLMLLVSSPILGLSPLMPLALRTIGSVVWGAANVWIGIQLSKKSEEVL